VQEACGSTAVGLDLGPHVSGAAAGELVLLKTTIEHATRMPAEMMREQVKAAYHRLGSALATTNREPIRFWNFIPDVGEAMGGGIDRYMVFNAGRYDAFSGASDAGYCFKRPLATASALGIEGAHLVVYCLASSAPATAIENPRQKSSWCYSSRYGPLPPCFSRATLTTIDGRSRLLIGGTASIVGEESRHQWDAAAQLEETLRNLASVVTAVTHSSDPIGHALARLVDVQVYVTRDEAADALRREIRERCPRADRIDLVRARICRPELLLEIEAVAEI
jgi:chorismate lyase/3-hydroxybenzoate synthase